MGWNDHSPYFEMIEDRMADIIDEARDNGEFIDDETAYMRACDEITNEMRDAFIIQRMIRIDAIGE
jgi:hypothetical protein